MMVGQVQLGLTAARFAAALGEIPERDADRTARTRLVLGTGIRARHWACQGPALYGNSETDPVPLPREARNRAPLDRGFVLDYEFH